MNVTGRWHDANMMKPEHFKDAQRQHGLITREQFLEHGSVRQLELLLAAGRLESARRGVYRIAGAPTTWQQQLLSACLVSGQSARASFDTAAAIVGLDGFARGPLQITVEQGKRVRLAKVTVHQSTIDLPTHRTVKNGIPVTSVSRTLADLSWRLPSWRIGYLLDDAIRRRLTTLDDYRQVARDLQRRGRRRTTVTRDVLERRTPETAGAESGSERRLVQLLIAAGLPMPVLQHPVRVSGRTVRLDLAYPDAMIAIEYDGWGVHGTRAAFDRDRRRANELEVLGWTVVRFTSDFADSTIIATVRQLLERRSVS